jgi:predicted glutamine amidotransferase
MCRMFGLAATRPVALSDLLCEAPRSLRALSHEHRDGWGVAIRTADGWRIDRDTKSAAVCNRYLELAAIEATLAIAHVRNKTVGDISLANTHPFRRGPFVFAHNGTVRDLAAVIARSAPEHLAALEGDTDSERLFAFVLTHIDEAGDISRGVAAAVRALHAITDVGSVNFLLSCGARLYAHRLGRSLYTLTRDDVSVVASEPLTDEPWLELAERQLVILETVEPAMRSAA